MPIEGRIDILMTLDGDLAVTAEGDLALTSGFDWLAREVNKVVRTVNPTWRHHPTIGAGLSEFSGEPNTREVGSRISQTLREALQNLRIPELEGVAVDVIPVDLWAIAVIVWIRSADSRITLSKTIFDFQDGVPQPLRDPEVEVLTPRTQVDPLHRIAPFNKYRSRNPGR